MAIATAAPPDAGLEPPPGDALYEVVDGRIMELPPMGAYSTWLASLLNQLLGAHARAQGLGRVASEMLFRIDAASGLCRRPDVAFVSEARWPRGRRLPDEHAWDVIPELAVEVVSPSNLAEEVAGKVHEYFRAGVTHVWVVYPKQAEIYIYESPTRIRILGRGDVLEGEPALPGFRLPLAELFEGRDDQ